MSHGMHEPQPAQARAARDGTAHETDGAAREGKTGTAPTARLAFTVLEAPRADPLTLWDALPGAAAAFWRAPDGPEIAGLAGVGVAADLRAEGPERFFALASQARALVEAQGEPWPEGLRFVGGLAFDARGGGSPRWRGFGAARFFLPRFTYLPGLRRGRLIVCQAEADDAKQIEAQTHAVLRALDQNAPASPQGLWPARIDRLPREVWASWIARVQAAISSGAVRKVVLARESVLDLPVEISPRAILSRLSAEHHDCFCFGLRFGPPGDQAAFVGASPERLLRLDGTRARVDALAGTAGVPGRGEGSGALERNTRALSGSDKDLAEHRFVVEAIEHALRPRCESLSIPVAPVVRRLRHVLHLHTPIEGTLAAEAHLLEIADTLHPTPAVAGTPTAEARAILDACEARDRGFYAGPIGHFDATGSGELCVGLRSGLLRGKAAHVFAGAGVVAGSQAEAEYEETRLKEQALYQALGVAP